jgi:predicted dehydrogenase
MSEKIRCGVIGYGGAFNMGRAHAEYITQTDGLELHSICDISPERTAVAQQDFPTAAIFNDVAEMLNAPELDLVVIVLPHNLHAPIAIQASQAGKHVVVEKPMCITTEEATAMIEAARAAGKMVSVFHNRRQDADYRMLRELVVEKQIIGEVFSVEIWGGGYNAPNPQWWRSSKKVSGGHFYDWGAHYLDWMLGLIPGKVDHVTGYFHKRVWQEVDIEDQVQALIKFDTGCVVNITMSSIAHAGKPRWWLLGEKGAIVDRGGYFEVTGNFETEGYPAMLKVPYRGNSEWKTYYSNVANHLLHGSDLGVKPEQARRVISIMDYAERSSQQNRSLELPHDDEDSRFLRSE